MMQREGIIGPPDGSRPRDVFKRPDWLDLPAKTDSALSAGISVFRRLNTRGPDLSPGLPGIFLLTNSAPL